MVGLLPVPMLLLLFSSHIYSSHSCIKSHGIIAGDKTSSLSSLSHSYPSLDDLYHGTR